MKALAFVVLLLASTQARADEDADFLKPIEVPALGNPERAQAEIRDFIWAHWTQRSKRGFIQAVFHSGEGERSQTNAVVGPEGAPFVHHGAAPRWRLAVTILREMGEPASFVAYDLALGPSAADRTRTVLILKGENGAMLGEW